jgi:hypothetical protein
VGYLPTGTAYEKQGFLWAQGPKGHGTMTAFDLIFCGQTFTAKFEFFHLFFYTYKKCHFENP